MRKLLITLIAMAPLLAMAEGTYHLYVFSTYNNPSGIFPQPNQLSLVKVSDKCIHSVEPAGGLIPYGGTSRIRIKIVDSNEYPTCDNQPKYQIFDITSKTKAGGQALLGKIEFVHWWHSGYGKWFTEIVQINPVSSLAIKADCQYGLLWYYDCLRNSFDISDVGIEKVENIRITFSKK